VVEAWEHAYTEAVRQRKKLTVFQTRHILDIDGALLKVLPKQRDRKILHSRLNEYLNGSRRGRLRLPSHFPREVQALAGMSKAHIRRSQYWVKPSTEFHQRLSKSLVKWVNQVAPGTYWTSTSSKEALQASAVVVPRLRLTESPGASRSQWPSCVSFTEMIHMSRTGKQLTIQDNFRSLSVMGCLKNRDVHENHALATRIVRQQVVGVRAEVEVPRKFLKYFRYRYGFLILSVRFCLPIGLVRFLLSQWVCNFTSLWLVEPVRYKFYLRRKRASDFIRPAVPSITITDCDLPVSRPKAKVSSAKRRYQQRRKVERKFDQMLEKRFGLDPALF